MINTTPEIEAKHREVKELRKRLLDVIGETDFTIAMLALAEATSTKVIEIRDDLLANPSYEKLLIANFTMVDWVNILKPDIDLANGIKEKPFPDITLEVK